MEKHHFQWVNPLFLWSCSIDILVYQRVNPIKIPLNPIFNSYVKLPEGILASFLARSDDSQRPSPSDTVPVVAQVAIDGTGQVFPEHSHPPAGSTRSTPTALGWFVRYLNGSVSKPCTPGEHKNSW